MPPFLQDVLRLNAEQKKKVADLQKEVDAGVDKLLTPAQREQLRRAREGGGPPAPPPPPPGP